uniref:Uncharacterized protein n=1 Tax=Timema douglasi TaxID=61478 RepID=A0A7R8VP77_TIMDO|nr:unnamed protein product [Timema douglasi]
MSRCTVVYSSQAGGSQVQRPMWRRAPPPPSPPYSSDGHHGDVTLSFKSRGPFCNDRRLRDQNNYANGLGMSKVGLRRNGLVFGWREGGKLFRRNHSQYTQPESNHDLPVIGSIIYCESSALDRAATEV